VRNTEIIVTPSLTTTRPERAPSCEGVKRHRDVPLSPAASFTGEAPTGVKSSGVPNASSRATVTVSAPPTLRSVTTCSDEPPSVTAPKSTVVGATVSASFVVQTHALLATISRRLIS
jgi:hypothetical protein